MNEKELYQQKKQAQLDQWRAEVNRLKAKASDASADIQLKLNQEIDSLEKRIEEGRVKLDAMTQASEEAWGSLKVGIESAWDSMAAAFSEAASKFKN